MRSEGFQRDPSAVQADPRLVSVVMPFLNAREFLPEAVASVRNQSYDHWELLLIDDGSTDGGTEIARRFAEEDPDRVRYLEHEGHRNLGASAARNLGLRHARGGFLAFLDADDVWLPKKLEDQLRILAEQPEAAMVYGHTEYWYGWTGDPGDAVFDRVPPLGVELDRLHRAPSLFPTLFLTIRVTTPCTCSVLLRREVVDRIGGFEESFRKVFTDQVFYAKLFLEEDVYVASGCWDRYRQHPGSSCQTAQRERRLDAIRGAFLEWLEGYLREKGFQDTDFWRGLQRALFPYRHPVLGAIVRFPSRAATFATWSARLPRRAVRKSLRLMGRSGPRATGPR